MTKAMNVEATARDFAGPRSALLLGEMAQARRHLDVEITEDIDWPVTARPRQRCGPVTYAVLSCMAPGLQTGVHDYPAARPGSLTQLDGAGSCGSTNSGSCSGTR